MYRYGVLLMLLVVGACATSQTSSNTNVVLSPEQKQAMRTLTRTFYTDALTATGDKAKHKAAIKNTLARGYQSMTGNNTENRRQMIKGIQQMHTLIPDVRFEPQEILLSGNKVIVRSMFSGTPKGNFMGVALDGTKSFTAMSIDIHTFEDGKIKQTYHVEDWAQVMQQLTGNAKDKK